MKSKKLIPFMAPLPSRKGNKRNKSYACDLTTLVAYLYDANVRLAAENARLSEQLNASHVIAGEFITLIPVNSKEDEDA